MRFMYVLPFSPRRALVEYTLFSADLLPEAAYEAYNPTKAARAPSKDLMLIVLP